MRRIPLATHLLLLSFVLASGCATSGPFSIGSPESSSSETRSSSTSQSPRGALLFVTADRVNLRSCPSSNCKVIAVLKHGDEIAKLGQENTWVNIRVKGTNREGWVASRLIGKKPKRKASTGINEEWSPQKKSKQESPKLNEEFSP